MLPHVQIDKEVLSLAQNMINNQTPEFHAQEIQILHA